MQQHAAIADRRSGQRVAVIVDGANLEHALARMGRARIDVARLSNYAAAYGTGKPSVHWFMPARRSLQRFAHVLRDHGVAVHQRAITRLPDGRDKCDQDADIAACMLDQPEDVGTMLLLTGDGDFTFAARCLQRRSVRVILLAHRSMAAASWTAVLDRHDRLDLVHEISHFQFR